MAALFVLLITIGCGVYQYLKGTLVKSFATLVITICASIIAFGHYERIANIVIKKADFERLTVGSWAPAVIFLILFMLSFAVLLEITNRLIKKEIDLGPLTEQIGRGICGIVLGFFLSGIILTAAVMAPVSNGLPYQRFEKTNPDPQNPNKTFLNADGFATGWFTMVSNGAFSGKKNFASLHPDFLDQLFLNRLGAKKNVPPIAIKPAIVIPPNQAAWPAPKELKDFDDPNLPIQQKAGYSLTIVRMGLKTAAFRYTGPFSLSQIRLICKHKDDAKNPLKGSATNVFPVGYMQAGNLLQKKRLNEKIRLSMEDFGEEGLKQIDLAFYIPDNFVAVFIQLKQNDIAKVPPLTPAEQAPEIIPFTLPAETQPDANEPNTPADANSDADVNSELP